MQRNFSYAVLALSVVLPIEVGACVIAYYTIGAIISVLILLSLLANIVFLVISIAFPRTGLVAMALVAVLVVAPQIGLAVRMLHTHNEAQRIIGWAQTERLRTGTYPSSLDSYTFACPEHRKYLRYHRWRDQDVFEVVYYIGTPNTGHRYSSNNGWVYIDD
jgi:hypothetical protein